MNKQLFSNSPFGYIFEDWLTLRIYDTLPKKTKIVFDFLVQGYTEDEIASILNIKPKSVYCQIRRIRKKYTFVHGLTVDRREEMDQRFME